MKACELSGIDIGTILWMTHFGSSFLVYVAAVISIFTASFIVMYKLTGGR